MKKWFAIIPLVMFGLPAHAETVAEQLQYKLAKLNSFQASFVQQVTDKQQKPVQEDGEGYLVLKQPARFRIETTTPVANLLIGDGKTLWHYDPELEMLSVYDAKKEVQQTPFVLLTSNDSALWSQYHVTGAAEHFVITPKDSKNTVKKLELRFSGLGLSQMTLLDNNGQTTNFEFVTSQNNIPVDDSQFKFVPPPGVSIDDQRQRLSHP